MTRILAVWCIAQLALVACKQPGTSAPEKSGNKTLPGLGGGDEVSDSGWLNSGEAVAFCKGTVWEDLKDKGIGITVYMYKNREAPAEVAKEVEMWKPDDPKGLIVLKSHIFEFNLLEGFETGRPVEVKDAEIEPEPVVNAEAPLERWGPVQSGQLVIRRVSLPSRDDCGGGFEIEFSNLVFGSTGPFSGRCAENEWETVYRDRSGGTWPNDCLMRKYDRKKDSDD